MIERKSNMELLRVAAMFYIVASHIVGHCVFQIYGGGDAVYEFFSHGTLANRITAGLFAAGGDMGNYIFFLLMGYFSNFQLNDEKKINKVLKLTVEVVFYAAVSVMIFAFSYISGIYKFEDMGTKGIVSTLVSLCLPVTSEVWWFITTYVIIFITLNSFSIIDKLTKNQFLKVLIVFFLINMARFNSGRYNIFLNCLFVVFLGIYIRKFAQAEGIGTNKKIFLAVISILLWVGAAWSTVFFYRYSLADSSFSLRIISRIVSEIGRYMKIFFAAAMLLLFSHLNIGFNRMINRIASSTFSIYLFHGSPFFVYLIFKHTGVISEQYNTDLFPLYLIADIALIFIVSMILDYVQKNINGRVVNKISVIGGKFLDLKEPNSM